MTYPRYGMILVASVLLGVLGCRAEEKHFDRTFSVSPGGQLMVDTDIGSVQVTGGSGTEVVVAATIRGSQRQIEEFSVTAEKRENVVEVIGKWTSEGRSWRHRDLDVEFVIQVPREFNVKVGPPAAPFTSHH